MKPLICLLTAFFLTGCSTWSDEENALYGLLVASQVADTALSDQINDNPNVAEGNPLFARGSDVNIPLVVVVKAALLAGAYWHFDRHPNQRKWLYLIDAITVGIVVNNERVLK